MAARRLATDPAGFAVGAIAREVVPPRRSLAIKADRVVTLTLTVRDETGEVFESSDYEGRPFTYLHGHGNTVPGLEAALRGRRAGYAFDLMIEPKDGYGESQGDTLVRLPRAMFVGEFEPGDELVFETEEGGEAPLWVMAIEGDTVVVDLEHPLAGVRLRYQGRVLAVRDAAEVELAQHHPLDDGDDD